MSSALIKHSTLIEKLVATHCGLVVCVVGGSWTNMPVWLLDSGSAHGSVDNS